MIRFDQIFSQDFRNGQKFWLKLFSFFRAQNLWNVKVALTESVTMTRWVSHHQNFIMIIYNLCQIKTPKLNFRIKWFAGIKLISKVSVYNFDLSALNETSDQWQILDPDVEDSHILPLGTLFKVSLCQSLSENSSYFRPSLNSKLILISKLILVLLGGLLKKQETEFGFQMQQILDVLEWLKTDVNIDKVRKHKSKIWASGTGSKRLYHISYMI